MAVTGTHHMLQDPPPIGPGMLPRDGDLTPASHPARLPGDHAVPPGSSG